MILTRIEELRMAIPAHAIDNIEQLTGFFENSEQDFLKEKLGDSLYARLVQEYRNLDIDEWLSKLVNSEQLSPWEQLLFLAQRCIAFDAMGRAVSVQAISVNNAGINISTSDDYQKVDKETITAYKLQCSKEAHTAMNTLLQYLEGLVSLVKQRSSEETLLTAETTESGEIDNLLADQKLITELWQSSRYYFLVASLLIPTASIMQEFVNIYENREKYIQLLPDLHYVQEEQIAPSIGEEFLDYLVDKSIQGTEIKLLSKLIYKLRKALASGVVARSVVLAAKKERQQQAHDELIGYLKSICEYIKVNQDKFPEDAIDALKLSPCYVEQDKKPRKPLFENKTSNSLFVTPFMH